MKIAILDDWQDVARTSADWSKLGARAELVFFADAFGSEDEAARALEDFDILLTMRERTAFPETPDPPPSQAAHDRDHWPFEPHGGRRGLHASGRDGLQHAAQRRSVRDGRAGAWSDDRRRPRDSGCRQGHARRRLPARRACGHGACRQDPRHRGARPSRGASRALCARARHEGHRLESELDRGQSQRGRRRSSSASRI